MEDIRFTKQNAAQKLQKYSNLYVHNECVGINILPMMGCRCVFFSWLHTQHITTPVRTFLYHINTQPNLCHCAYFFTPQKTWTQTNFSFFVQNELFIQLFII